MTLLFLFPCFLIMHPTDNRWDDWIETSTRSLVSIDQWIDAVLMSPLLREVVLVLFHAHVEGCPQSQGSLPS
ncbi:hypothetical protein BKA80DRAFT_222589 [Phyllosticta citrichinensis]